MRKYGIALFDLDGTLSESGEGILECVRSIFTEMKRPLPDEEEIRRFIGPPMYESLKRVGFNDKDAETGVEIYKRNFVKTGIYKNKVYDGMFDVLERLKAEGVRLGVASTKYQLFTDRIIHMLELDKYFDIIGGSTSLTGDIPENETPRHDKIDVMNYVINSLKKDDSDRVVMIGDTKYDADGAAKVGCDFIGCLFGYGTKEEMIEYYTCGLPMFVSCPKEITGLIVKPDINANSSGSTMPIF